MQINPTICMISVAEYIPYRSVSPPLKAIITEMSTPVSRVRK
jgi:hypothetical protein